MKGFNWLSVFVLCRYLDSDIGILNIFSSKMLILIHKQIFTTNQISCNWMNQSFLYFYGICNECFVAVRNSWEHSSGSHIVYSTVQMNWDRHAIMWCRHHCYTISILFYNKQHNLTSQKVSAYEILCALQISCEICILCFYYCFMFVCLLTFPTIYNSPTRNILTMVYLISICTRILNNFSICQWHTHTHTHTRNILFIRFNLESSESSETTLPNTMNTPSGWLCCHYQ